MEIYLSAISQSHFNLLTLKLYTECECPTYRTFKESSLSTFQSTYHSNSILTVYDSVALCLLIYVGGLISGISHWYLKALKNVKML